MKLGYPTHPRKPLIQELTWISDNGFEFADLFLEPDACDFHQVNPREIKTFLKDHALDSVGHTPWYIPIGSPQRDLRQAAVDVTGKYLHTFAEIGCTKVTLHANWSSSMFSSLEGVDFQCDSLARIVSQAEQLGIVILFEPVGAAHETAENLRLFFQRLPKMAFHLDIGHFNLNGRNPADFAEAFADKLAHVHLHDNDGNRDLHLPMGTGKINWPDLIPRLKKVYDGTITLEIFTSDRDYVLLSKKKFHKLWNES